MTENNILGIILAIVNAIMSIFLTEDTPINESSNSSSRRFDRRILHG